MEIRVGNGIDIHPLCEGIPLYIGGIEIPFYKGSKGHSDGDALLHAISDALLGAAGLDDIGELFPDTDMKIKGIRSSEILKKILLLLAQNHWQIVNIDANIILEKPKLGAIKKDIAQNIAGLCRISEDRVSVKAKTFEKMGEIGNGNAIMATVSLLLIRTNL